MEIQFFFYAIINTIAKNMLNILVRYCFAVVIWIFIRFACYFSIKLAAWCFNLCSILALFVFLGKIGYYNGVYQSGRKLIREKLARNSQSDKL